MGMCVATGTGAVGEGKGWQASHLPRAAKDFSQPWWHTLYRVVKNDFRGFHNLSCTIHL